jgi:hypothetical protein
MTLEDHVLAGAMVLACVTFYFVYWLGWCWAWHYVWPHGPHWITRPSFFGFLLTCFTGVIITLVIIKPN